MNLINLDRMIGRIVTVGVLILAAVVTGGCAYARIHGPLRTTPLLDVPHDAVRGDCSPALPCSSETWV